MCGWDYLMIIIIFVLGFFSMAYNHCFIATLFIICGFSIAIIKYLKEE